MEDPRLPVAAKGAAEESEDEADAVAVEAFAVFVEQVIDCSNWMGI